MARALCAVKVIICLGVDVIPVRVVALCALQERIVLGARKDITNQDHRALPVRVAVLDVHPIRIVLDVRRDITNQDHHALPVQVVVESARHIGIVLHVKKDIMLLERRVADAMIIHASRARLMMIAWHARMAIMYQVVRVVNVLLAAVPVHRILTALDARKIIYLLRGVACHVKKLRRILIAFSVMNARV